MMVAPLGTQQNDWDTAALKGCLQLKSLLTAGNSKLLGFDSPADASLAQIGMPFDIYTVGIDKLRDYLPGKPVEPLFEKIDARFYPLSVAGEVRSSLVVSQRKSTNELITTSWGLMRLAKVVTKYRTSPNQFIVWCPDLNIHLLGIHPDDTFILIPLATRKSLGLEEGVPVSASVAFALLAHYARTIDTAKPGWLRPAHCINCN